MTLPAFLSPPPSYFPLLREELSSHLPSDPQWGIVSWVLFFLAKALSLALLFWSRFKFWSPRPHKPKSIQPWPTGIVHPFSGCFPGTLWRAHLYAVQSTVTIYGLKYRRQSPVVSSFNRKMRIPVHQEDCHESKATLGYIISSKPAYITVWDPVSKKKNSVPLLSCLPHQYQPGHAWRPFPFHNTVWPLLI